MKELGFYIKGHAKIFNQEFRNTPYFRVGSANDVEYLTTTFTRLGMVSTVKSDLKYKEIVEEIDLRKCTSTRHKL